MYWQLNKNSYITLRKISLVENILYDTFISYLRGGNMIPTKTKQSRFQWRSLITIGLLVGLMIGIMAESLNQENFVSAPIVRAESIHQTSTNHMDTMRSTLMSMLWNRIQDLFKSRWIVNNTGMIWYLSDTLWWPWETSDNTNFSSVKEECVPIVTNDIFEHRYERELQRAVDHCIIKWYGNNKLYPDNDLTHNAMLIIAQRIGFRVDLSRWSEDSVSRSELLEFIDYLQSSQQITMVPVIVLDPAIKRSQYIALMYQLAPNSMKQNPSPIQEVNTGNLHSVAPTTWSSIQSWSITMTVKTFKESLNTTYNANIAITSYDDQINLTPEIAISLLQEAKVWPEWASLLEQVSVNKDTIKKSLLRAVEQL